MKIVIVNGLPGCGKSTFEELATLNTKYHIGIFSTVDKVKSIAKSIGWNGQKTPKDRLFLSNLKDLLTQYDDIPYKDTVKSIILWRDDLVNNNFNEEEMVAFIDVREPEEIEKFKTKLNAITLLIVRNTKDYNTTAADASNHADANVFNYSYDYVVENNGTLEDLEESAISFLNEIFEK